MNKKIIFIVIIAICSLLAIFFLLQKYHHKKISLYNLTKTTNPKTQLSKTTNLNPLTIQAMRERKYPGSVITIEQTLPDGQNYHQYLTSYMSDNLKIYALLTVPKGDKPKNGWPVILFNHGYIPPETYQTNPSVGQYANYLPVLANAGYIVFKPDYRGNGNSDGKPEGAYYSPAYAVDDLNALASIQKYKDADPNKVGIWAHSMGGNITLRDLVIKPNEIKVAVIWGGVVGSYTDLMYNWLHKVPYHPSPRELTLRNNDRQKLVSQYGTPQTNPTFWDSIDPTYFVKDITAPVQLDVGGSDEEVPVAFSQSLRDTLQQAGKTVAYYEYPDDNHNISANFNLAMQHSLEFFDKYLK